MDKGFFYKKWNVRMISLAFAVLLYIFVASENNAFVFQTAANQQFASINVSETINNVPVKVGAIGENRFISGLPETVSVRISGPKNIVSQVVEKNFVVQTEDLTAMPTGTQQIRFVIEGLPDSIEYQVTPSRQYVKISQMKTVTMPVTYEVARSAIATGYEAQVVTLSPEQVELTGDAEIIDKIAKAFIEIDADQPNQSDFTASYPLQIVDAQGDVLDVNADVAEITATVRVARPQAEVPMNVVPYGEDTTKYSYTYEITTPATLVLEGSSVRQTNSVDVVVDVTGLTSSNVVYGVMQVPEGLTVVNSQEVQVLVTVTPLDGQVEESTIEESLSETESEPEASASESDVTSLESSSQEATDESSAP